MSYLHNENFESVLFIRNVQTFSIGVLHCCLQREKGSLEISGAFVVDGDDSGNEFLADFGDCAILLGERSKVQSFYALVRKRDWGTRSRRLSPGTYCTCLQEQRRCEQT